MFYIYSYHFGIYCICIPSKNNRTEVFFKKLFLKISQNSQENTFAGVSLSAARNFFKIENPHRFFPVNFCEIFENIPFN